MEKKEHKTFLKGILWVLIPLYVITWISMLLSIFLVAPPFIYMAIWGPILWLLYTLACKRSLKYDLGECPKKDKKIIVMKKDVSN